MTHETDRQQRDRLRREDFRELCTDFTDDDWQMLREIGEKFGLADYEFEQDGRVIRKPQSEPF